MLRRTVAALALAAAWQSESVAAQDACVNSADFGFWEREGFARHEDDLLTCGKESKGDEQLAEECVDRVMPEYTEACQQCFVDIIHCTGVECGSSCISTIFTGSESEECRACVETTCNGDFEICAGFPIETCETCILPEDSEFPVIPVAATVGGVVFLGVAVLFVRWLRKPPLTHEEKVARVERRVADLGIKEILELPPASKASSVPGSETATARGSSIATYSVSTRPSYMGYNDDDDDLNTPDF